jgi:hypothetical protein
MSFCDIFGAPREVQAVPSQCLRPFCQPSIQDVAKDASIMLCMQGPIQQRSIHSTAKLNGTVDVLLAQTGEGIKECELIQWFVKVC